MLSNCYMTTTKDSKLRMSLDQVPVPWACLWVNTASVRCMCLFRSCELPIWLHFCAEVTVVTLVLGLDVGLLDTLERSWAGWEGEEWEGVEPMMKSLFPSNFLSCRTLKLTPLKRCTGSLRKWRNLLHQSDSTAKVLPPTPALPLSLRARQAAWQLGKQVDWPAQGSQRPSLFESYPWPSSSSQHLDPEAQRLHGFRCEWALQSESLQSHPRAKRKAGLWVNISSSFYSNWYFGFGMRFQIVVFPFHACSENS